MSIAILAVGYSSAICAGGSAVCRLRKTSLFSAPAGNLLILWGSMLPLLMISERSLQIGVRYLLGDARLACGPLVAPVRRVYRRVLFNIAGDDSK